MPLKINKKAGKKMRYTQILRQLSQFYYCEEKRASATQYPKRRW